MIEYIELVNFQPHKKRRIDLDPHITTIVGSTDVGKSSTIRALRWVCLNDAHGVRILRRGAKFVAVRIQVDGHKVARKRVGQTNSYTLDGKKFSAFRSEVPEEIATLLNISDINFQAQHDSPFWLSLSAGEVSRSLNRIVNLGRIDDALAEVSRRLRNATSAVEFTQERLEVARAEKKALSFVPFLTRDLKELTTLEEEMAHKRQEWVRLRGLVKQVSEHQEAQRNRNGAILEGQAVLELGEEYQRTKKRRDRLTELVQTLRGTQRTALQPIPDLGTLEDLYTQAKDQRERTAQLRELVGRIQLQQERIDLLDRDSRTAETKLHKLMKGRCPLCGQNLPPA